MGITLSAINRPGSNLQTADNKQIGISPSGTNPAALHIEQYTGEVEGTIARKSLMENFIPTRTVQGTDIVSKFRVGDATLQKLTPGVAPDGTVVQSAKGSLRVDTVVMARNITPTLDDFQNSFDARTAVAAEHGKKIAKFKDQAFFIQAIKAGLITDMSGYPSGWNPGTQVTLATAGDENDPAKLYAAFSNLFAQMEEKDVDPIDDDLIIVTRPTRRYTLLNNELLIDRQYKTSDGTEIKTKALEAFGVPVFGSVNLPNSNITGHFLSNAGNSNAYDLDASKVIAVVFSPKALLAGSTIPLQHKVWFDDNTKCWNIDDWLAFGVGPDNPAFAGVIKAA
ncbi:hypothetical protein SMA75_20250 [Escherichia coli]|uniref:hypothetical protein n=1 Tax=Escherichia coli TaxID=562 RepID=UPI00307AB73C